MKRARVIRIDMGYSVFVVAQYMGVDKDLLVRYERGSKPLPSAAMAKLAEFLHVDEALLDEDVETLMHRARIESPLKMMEICDKVGMSRGRFTQIEEYKSKPTFEEGLAIGKALGIHRWKLQATIPMEKVADGYRRNKQYRPREDTSICVFCKGKIFRHPLCKRCRCLLHAEGALTHENAEEVTEAGSGLCISCDGAIRGLRYDQLTAVQSRA